MAQSLPLTRWVARSKSLQLFDLLAGFSYSQVLYTCVKLRILDHVGQLGISPSGLAGKTGLAEPKMDTLLRAAVALDILALDRSNVILGPHGAALLGQPWIMRFVEHHQYFYRDLEDPVALLQGATANGGLKSFWTYEDGESDKSTYSALMAASQAAVSQQILSAYDFSRHKSVLDIGGGTGAFLGALTQKYPHINAHLFDLEGVVRLAGENSGLQLHSGDFRHDPLPNGMDIISLIRVVHDHDDDVILGLFRRIRAVCTKQTTLLIAEPFAGQSATARVTDAYFNMYFAAMGQGRTRSPKDIARLAAEAGFGQLKIWPTNMPLITGMLTLQPSS